MREFSISALALLLFATQGSAPAGAQARDAIPAATLGMLDSASPAEPSASPTATPLLSHADSLAFQGVSRNVGPWSKLLVMGPSGSFGARGSDVTPLGIRQGAVPVGAGGPDPALVSWSEIERVQVRGSAAGTGAKIGGATCGLLGLGLAVILSTTDIGLSSSSDTGAREVVAFTAACTMSGAIVGGMIGALTPRWKTIHSWAGF